MSEYRPYSTKIWETRLCSSEGRGVVAIFGLGCVLNQVSSWGQMRFGLTGEWVKLGLVCVLVCQVKFRLYLSDMSG